MRCLCIPVCNILISCILILFELQSISMYIYLFNWILISRSECKERVLACLSEESIRKRRRRNTIGIQITIISWFLEFFAGLINLSRYWMMQDNQESEWTDRLFIVFDTFVFFVLVPSSYLLNNEAVKIFIAAKGWTMFILSRFRQSIPHNQNKWNHNLA